MKPLTPKLSLGAIAVLFLMRHGAAMEAPFTVVTPPPFAAPQAMNFTVEGKITRHSSGKLVVSSEANIIFHVTYDERTDIRRRDGSRGSSKDLQVGIKIKVEGQLTEKGEVVAEKIRIEPDASSKKP